MINVVDRRCEFIDVWELDRPKIVGANDRKIRRVDLVPSFTYVNILVSNYEVSDRAGWTIILRVVLSCLFQKQTVAIRCNYGFSYNVPANETPMFIFNYLSSPRLHKTAIDRLLAYLQAPTTSVGTKIMQMQRKKICVSPFLYRLSYRHTLILLGRRLLTLSLTLVSKFN